MVVCAFWQSSNRVWDEFRPAVYDGYTVREAIRRYREKYGITGKRGIVIMVGTGFDNMKAWRGSWRKTFGG